MKSKPNSANIANSAASEDLLEKVLYDFESSWFKNRSTTIQEFLPEKNHPRYQEILVELIRAHMELSQDCDQPQTASQYFKQFDDVQFDDSAKKAIVFEEFRQASNRGGKRSLQSLGFQYDLDFSGFSSDGEPAKKIEFPEAGSQIGEFNLIGTLGEGAYGRVFLAQQKQLEDRLVVLKFSNQTTVEHRLLARMQHTNIVPIHSVHKFEDLQAICMPLLGIITLRDLLQKTEIPSQGLQDRALIQTIMKSKEDTVVDSISDQKCATRFLKRQDFEHGDYQPIRRSFASRNGVIEITKKIAEGLGYAHQRGIVHGDLKPANILISDDGEPIILDFHLGRSVAGNIGNLVGGTIPYMPPEQLRNFENEYSEPTPRYDVYAAGALIYELLTGKPPFVDSIGGCKDLNEIANRKSVPWIAAENKHHIEPDLTSIIEKCLSPDPNSRFKDGTELAAELSRCLNYQPLKQANRGSLSNRFAKWAKRHPKISSASVVSTLAACIIGLLVAGIWLLNARLGAIAATEASNKRIESANSLRPALASAFDGRMDESAFQTSIDSANALIEDNTWGDLAEIEASSESSRLSNDQLDSEKLSAGEVHFWLAELYQNLPNNIDDEKAQSNLQLAKKHNAKGRAIWPAGRSDLALQEQWNELDGDATEPSDQQPDNFEDRLLWTMSQDLTLSEKQNAYESLAKERKDHFASWLLLANVCSRQSSSEKAIAYYNVCQSIDPDSHIPWLFEGMENLKQNNHSEALKNLTKAESLAPDDITVLLNLALALGKNRKLDDALKKYDKAIELGAHQTRAYYLRSRLKNALGDREGAKKDYDHFMSTEPMDELSCITRGVRLLPTDPQLAIADYKKALKYDSRSMAAFNNLANVYSETLKDSKTAIGYLDKAINSKPDEPVLYASRAVLQARLGHEAESLADAKKAVQLERSGNIFYRIAGVYAQLSKLDRKHIGTALKFLAMAAFDDPPTVLRLRKNDPDFEPLAENSAAKDVFLFLSKMAKEARR